MRFANKFLEISYIVQKVFVLATKELEVFEYAIVSFWGLSLLTSEMERKILILITS